MIYRSADIGSPETAHKGNADGDELWNRSCLKPAKTEAEGELQGSSDIIANMKSSQPAFSSEEHQQMLTFSGSDKVPHLPYVYNSSASHCNPNFIGHYSRGGANMHDLFNGPFTPWQWMELEHQALIYKHITSNMPVPPSLLMPIRRAQSHAGYNAGHFTSMGWGGFHLGSQNNNDPEPGRCRRTDGKKWRCSRDAVADQKYCERHVNRGRHRLRKPIPTSSAVPAGNISGGQISEKQKVSLDKRSLHLETFEPGHDSRISMNKEMAGSNNLLVPPPSSIVLNPRESLYNIHNNKQNSYGQSFGSDFGLVSSDALKNPQLRPTHRFIDDCPKNQPDHTSRMWPDLLDDTQLSIAIPTASYHIKDGPSSLTLAWNFESMPMGLQLGGSKHTDQQQEGEDKHPHWIPVLRDSIIGGPLGEVLQNGK